MSKKFFLSPSILSADFSRMGEVMREIETVGCRYVHLDVMDGHFVPPITFGAQFIKSLRAKSPLFFDAHLMVDRPERFLQDFADAGCDGITFHIETTEKVSECFDIIKKNGKKTGLALNPATDVQKVEKYLDAIDYVLVMSVNPGYAAQKFIPESIEKVRKLDEIRKRNGYKYLIGIDGGVNLENAPSVKAAGADIIVSASAFFKSADKKSFREEIER